MPPQKRMGRVLEISLPSEDVKNKIKEEAKKRGCTASKYILSALDEANRPTRLGTGPDLQLREENYRLANDLRGKDLIIAQQEAELRKLRGAAFLQPSWNADIDSDLLKILKTGPIHDHRLLAALGASDTESARAISRQLQILEASGFVSKTSRGWCWKK